jgi:hypothetical protein
VALDIGFDESGAGDVLLVSLQLGTVQRARKLKTRWKAELEKVGLPFFHSKDFKNFSGGIFKKLTVEQRTKLLEVLTAIVRKRLSIGYTGKVTISLFDSKSDNTLRARWGTAYSFAIQMLLLVTRLWLDDHKLGADVNILVEDGHKNSNQIIEILHHGKTTDPALNIMTVGLGSKKDHPILQAADMLAYSEWQKLTRGDRDIWEALHVEGCQYLPGYLDLDEQLVGQALDYAQRAEIAQKLWRSTWGQKKPKLEGV